MNTPEFQLFWKQHQEKYQAIRDDLKRLHETVRKMAYPDRDEGVQVDVFPKPSTGDQAQYEKHLRALENARHLQEEAKRQEQRILQKLNCFAE